MGGGEKKPVDTGGVLLHGTSNEASKDKQGLELAIVLLTK